MSFLLEVFAKYCQIKSRNARTEIWLPWDIVGMCVFEVNYKISVRSDFWMRDHSTSNSLCHILNYLYRAKDGLLKLGLSVCCLPRQPACASSLARLPVFVSVPDINLHLKHHSNQYRLLSSTQTIKCTFCHVLCYKQHDHGDWNCVSLEQMENWTAMKTTVF